MTLGFFYVIKGLGKLIYALGKYTFIGAKTVFYNIGKYGGKGIWHFLNYLALGIYYFFIWEGKGIYAFLLLIVNFFKYFGLGLYYTFGGLWNLLTKTFIEKIRESSERNRRIREDKKEYAEKQKEKNKGKWKEKLKEAFRNIPLVKSFIAKQEAEREILLIDINSSDAKRSEAQQSFRYIAKDKDGKMVKGVFNGYSKLDVNSFLINEGYEVYKIETNKYINFIYGKIAIVLSKLNNKDLIFWLTQLSTYLKSGIPLTNAVRILSKQMGKSVSRRRVFDSVVYELSMGESFSRALEKQGNVFPNLLVNMIKAAEATGELEETLTDMADYYNETEKTRKQMVSAMTYPIIVLVFALGVVIFIMLYVIPQFTKIYTQSGIEVKGMTLAIVNISLFLRNNWPYLLIGIVGVIFIISLLYKNVKAFRLTFQTFLMNFPVIGKIIIYKEMTIFTKTFASLLKNNVYITESIDILSRITRNEIYRDIMFRTITNIAKGDKISDAFKDHWAIPEIAYYMIVTGESTGELAQMMQNVSNYYQEMHRNAVNGVKTLIEPVLIIFLATIVGVVILAVVIPMFDLYNTIQM